MSGSTNFEGMEHAHLRKMVATTDPATVLSRGTQLQSAGRVLKELSTALKSHVGNVTWEGPAAESFKAWVNNLQQSAQIIGDHATTAGDAMHQAGEALSTAKVAVPEPPKTELQTVDTYNKQPKSVKVPLYVIGQTPDEYMKSVPPYNWVSSAEYAAAKAKVDKEHQEAVLQMEKLAQAYSAATTTLNGIPSDVVLPGTPGSKSRGDESAYPDGGGSGGTGGAGGYVRKPRTGGGSVGGGSNPGGGETYGGGKVLPRDPGSGGPGPSNPGNTPPPPHGGGGQVPPAPQDPGTSIPPYHPSDPVNRPGTDLNSLPPSPTLPTQTGPYGTGGGHLPTDGPTTLPGYPNGPGGSNNGPGVPGGPVPGFPTGTGGGSIPAKGGGSGFVPNKGGGQIPARTTQFGGGPGQAKGGNPGLPSGTVFGAREAGAGGGRVGGATGMGGGMHPGMGGAHGGAVGAGGGSRARGLSSTTGGTVGGRKGPTTGGEFTPGGTGLRNRAAGAAEGGAPSRQNGMMAPGMAGHGGRNERDRRKRADYLHEDEETWTSGTPHSNPDVVE
ncbi:WXG100 family type VII secretion target [Kitasatospora sp. NPDC048286]|uniref:WXG100 family type VII secretion target n=1 Tax=Kitasatospora sp. NPDC048286 TaxID=3364047 RepID=UPI0037235100